MVPLYLPFLRTIGSVQIDEEKSQHTDFNDTLISTQGTMQSNSTVLLKKV